MTETLRILLVEDSPADALLVRKSLGLFELVHVERLRDAIALVAKDRFDVVLLDLGLPDTTGLESFRRFHSAVASLPIVLLTSEDESLGTIALREGAQDFLPKDEITAKSLARSIRYAVERHRAEEEIRGNERRMRELAESLEQRVAERTGLLKRQAWRLRRLALQLAETEQRERKQLARTLHDGLQQLLVAARMRTQMAGLATADRQAVEELARIDSLLDESIQTSRSLAMELSPPILHDGHVTDVLQWLARWFGDRHRLKVSTQIDTPIQTVPENVKTLLFQAARELLFNVVKHSGTNQAHVRLQQPPGRLRVEIEDQGRGFDPHLLDAERHQNGGLGLFSVRERLEAIGGSLKVESTPSKGSRFSLEIPVGVEEPGEQGRISEERPSEERPSEVRPRGTSRPAPLRPPGASEHPIRILLVDDHLIVRQGLVAMLGSHEDLEIVGEAGDGVEAVQQAHQLQPDVVVMDVNMPRMNGIEATRRIVEQFPAMHVIGLSLHAEEDMSEAMKAAGADCYLAKDGPLEKLVAAIRDARYAGQEA